MSMAIAYGMKKRKKMAEGGKAGVSTETVSSNRRHQKGVHESITGSDAGTSNAGAYVSGHGYGNNLEKAKQMHREKLNEMRSMKKPNLMAEGGQVSEDQATAQGMQKQYKEYNSAPYHESDKEKLAELAPQPMAEGGEVESAMHGEESDAHMLDMVERIMMKRKMMSEGGMVANSGEDELDEMADGRPNNFDDLSLRDELEEHYTGANSGDEIGNEQEDHDRADIVARIMNSRKKRDRMPRPA